MHDDTDNQAGGSGDQELPDAEGGGAGEAGDSDFDLSGFSEPGKAPAPGPKPAGKKPAGPSARGPREGGSKGTGRFDKRAGPQGRGPQGPRRGPAGQGPGGREGGSRGPGFPDRREGRGGPGGRPPREGGYAPRGGKPWDRDSRPQGGNFRDRGPRAEGPAGQRPGGDEPPRRRYAPPPGAIQPAPGLHRPASPEVKPYLALKQDKGRFRESRFLLEGAKNIADVLSISPAIFHEVFLAEDFKDKDLVAALKKARVRIVPATADDIAALSDTETPQGIVAVANFATLRPDYNVARYVTVLDGVQDPGNVGAILRTSLALGMDAVIMGKGTCDPYNPKVVRSSVGALLRLPFETDEGLESKIAFLRQKGYSVVASSSHARITLDQAKLRKKVALIVGNEGAGSGASFLDMADTVVKIPMKNMVESLNVAVAHGILSHQLIHGRE